MKKAAYATLLLLLCLPLGGCVKTYTQPEHQSYAISLSLDRAGNGQLTMGVQIPTIGGSAAQEGQSGGGESGGESGGGKSGYTVFTATAATFSEVLDLLGSTLPNQLRLSQLKSIVISEDLARTAEFPALVDEMLLTYQLYGAAPVIICRGEAKTFIKEQKPIIGIRLSTSVTSELEHYNSNGYTPLTSLHDLYASNHSPLSDPVLTLAATAQGAQEQRMQPIGGLGTNLPGTLPRTGGNKNEYIGCALIKEGRMVEVLNGRDSQWVEVIKHDVAHLSYSYQGKTMRLIRWARPRVTTNCAVEPMEVELLLRFGVASHEELPDLGTLSQALIDEISSLIERCQAMGVEPFDFAAKASTQFLTLPDFLKYDFKGRYPRAKINVDVQLNKTTL